MGIDVYLEWDGKEQFDGPLDDEALKRWSKIYNGKGVYIRESYFAKAYATHDFIPETFETYPFTDAPMTAGPDHWPDGVVPFRDGIHYPWTVLAGRIEAVAKKAHERYPDNPDATKDHIQAFMDFVDAVRALEESGVQSWVENSY